MDETENATSQPAPDAASQLARGASRDPVVQEELFGGPPQGRDFELIIDPVRRQLRITGEVIQLSYVEFALLMFLKNRPYWAFTRAELVEALAETPDPIVEASVDDHVATLRDKLRMFSDYVQTVPGIGYRFKE